MWVHKRLPVSANTVFVKTKTVLELLLVFNHLQYRKFGFDIYMYILGDPNSRTLQ